jgi:pseudomonalisin
VKLGFIARCRSLAVIAFLMGALGLAASAGAAGSAWVATHTRALHLSGALLGRAPANQALRISVTLPLRDASAVGRLIETHTVLTPAQVRARFSPTQSSVTAVESYLRQKGFAHLSVAGDRLLVTGDTTVAGAERAFHTSLSTYRLKGKLVYANTSAAKVPAALHGDVAAVLGLSDVPIAVPSAHASTSPDLTGFTPKAVAHAYDDSKMKAATNTTTAVVASGDMTPILANLRYAEKQWHYSAVPVQVIYDAPKAAIVNNNPLTGNLEWDLDTQISTMVPQAVKKLLIYDVGTFTDPEVARAFNLFVSQDKATALSASLGECDYIAWVDGAMLTTDEALAEGALQGQSSFASTGDNGYACPEVASTGVPEGPPGVSWPSDGEYTAAVGGTTLLADSNGNVQNELAWVGGGGGVSPYETAAPWTLQANGAGQTWEFTNQGGRSVPDVAALADSNTPYLVYAAHSKGTQPSGVGGTSVASPLTMGLWASISSAHGNGLGLASYDFYKVYDKTNPATVENGPLGPVYIPATNPKPVKGFRDITLGTNGGCVAKAGYDYCTGIGSVLAGQLSGQLHGGQRAAGQSARPKTKTHRRRSRHRRTRSHRAKNRRGFTG